MSDIDCYLKISMQVRWIIDITLICEYIAGILKTLYLACVGKYAVALGH